MNNILALTKVLIKNNVFGFSGQKKKGKSASTNGSVLGFVSLILICGLFMGIPIVLALKSLLSSYNLSELILSFVLPLGGFTSIIFGMFSIISVFYLNKDSEQLLHFPIKSSELLISKFLSSLISEYLILLMFIFPIILGVGIGINASFLFYVFSLIIFILMPIIPSVIISIIIMLANKIFNFSKRKDIFMYVMTGFILLFAFAYSFGIEYLIDDGSNGDLMAMLSGDVTNLIKISRYLFPTFNSATYSLVHYDEFIGFASIMTFVALNILFMVALYFIGDKLYIKGLTKTNGNKRDKKEKIKDYYKESKHGVMGELIKKEWLSIKRSPVFMLNIIIINLIFPLIFLISFLFGSTSEGEGISSLMEFVDFSNGGILFICIGVLLILCSMSSSASSAISREGSGAWMMKVVPISLKKQMDAKVYFSMIVDLVISFAIEIVLFLMFKPPWYYVLLVNIPLILILLISNYLSLILDLRKPRLDWKEESAAIKQNFNVFLAMVINILISAAFVVGGIVLLNVNVNIYLLFTFISVILLIMYLGLVCLIKKNQVKLFNKVG